MIDLGKRITDICTEKGIGLDELSQKSGVSVTTIKRIVNGKARNPRAITVFNICDGLGVAYSEFFKE